MVRERCRSGATSSGSRRAATSWRKRLSARRSRSSLNICAPCSAIRTIRRGRGNATERMNLHTNAVARSPSTQTARVIVASDRAPISAGGEWLRFASSVGTADAIYRNLAVVHARAPTRVLVRASDDAVDIDYESLIAAHRAHSLGATVGCVEVPIGIAQRFTVLGVDASGRVVRSAD